MASHSDQVFHADALNLADQTAKELFAAGQREEEAPFLRQALHSRERALGLEHPDTFENRNLLGRGCRAAGWHLQSIRLYQQNL